MQLGRHRPAARRVDGISRCREIAGPRL